MLLDAVLDPLADPGAAVELERAGYRAGWVTETVRDPFLCLAAAASATSQLQLGTGVAIAFARSPMTTALSAYDVQRASGGRFLLGLGSQVSAHVRHRFSMPWSHPAARMREYILALRAIWASWTDGVPLEFRGDFYRHTLMTPFFNPGPNGFPAPRVLLAGVGTGMTEVAGEVADGFVSGPLTSVRSLTEHALPAVARGLDRRAAPPAEAFDVCVMPMVITGATRADTDRVAQATRARLAFYASTPAYRPILELHGWGELHERLNALSRNQAWDEMTGLVDDDVLHAFAVVAEPDDVTDVLHQRFGAHATRAIVHTAADPGPGVWRAVAAGAARSTVGTR